MSAQARARTALARLELISHGTVGAPVGHVGTAAERPLLPGGGVAFLDDHEEDHRLRSHLHYAPRLAECRTPADFDALATEIESAIKAWRIAARPPKDSVPWKELVGKDGAAMTVRAVAAKWGISPTYAHQLIQQYRRAVAA